MFRKYLKKSWTKKDFFNSLNSNCIAYKQIWVTQARIIDKSKLQRKVNFCPHNETICILGHLREMKDKELTFVFDKSILHDMPSGKPIQIIRNLSKDKRIQENKIIRFHGLVLSFLSFPWNKLPFTLDSFIRMRCWQVLASKKHKCGDWI